jgi:SAM-dependent methyltransferase
MEFGCGDGNQLALMRYPSYVGVDVSPSAVKLCRAQFAEDPSKKFYILDQELQAEEAPKADLTLSLDVIYHLVEDEVFERHMEALFASSRRFVGI